MEKNKTNIKHNIILSILIIFLVATIAFANDIKTVSIKFITPIEVGKTSTVKGNFTNLTDKAQELGLADYIVVGQLTSGQALNGKIVHKISWHSLQKETSNGSKSKPLSPALTSNFKTKANLKVIKPNTTITAKGDLNSVIIALEKVKAEVEKTQSVKLENSKGIKIKNTLPKGYNQNGNYDSGSGSGSGSTNNFDNGQDLATVNTDTEQVKQCADRISTEMMQAFLQERTAIISENGTEKDAGTCRDTGKKYAMQKVYGGACTPLVGGTQVFQSFRIVYNNGKQDIIAQDCSRDTNDNILEVVETTQGCSAQLDFTNMKAIKQTRKYYTLDGVVNTVQACSPSSVQWAITEENCQWQYDPANNVAIKSTNLVYTDADNQKQNARACTPKTGDDSTVAVEEEFADTTHLDNYINDFATKSSWLKSRKYYLKDGGKVYVSNWVKGSKTYSHQEVIGSCTIEKDNENLKARQNSETMISVDGTDYKVRDCQGGQWINYKYLATVWKPVNIIENALIYGKLAEKTIDKTDDFGSVNYQFYYSCNSDIQGRSTCYNYNKTVQATHNWGLKTYQKITFQNEILVNNDNNIYTFADWYTTPSSYSVNVRSSSSYPKKYYNQVLTTNQGLKAQPNGNYSQIGDSPSWNNNVSVNLNDNLNYTPASKLLGSTNVITYHQKQKYKVLGNTFYYNYPTDSSGDNVVNTAIRLDNNANPADIE